jgi:hypothetical protein
LIFKNTTLHHRQDSTYLALHKFQSPKAEAIPLDHANRAEFKLARFKLARFKLARFKLARFKLARFKLARFKLACCMYIPGAIAELHR